MNPRKNSTCTSSGDTSWRFSTCYGTGIDGILLQPFRFRKDVKDSQGREYLQRHSLYGVSVESEEEAKKIGLEQGLIHYYGRNTCEFVMSRAYRKRGYRTNNALYHTSKKNAEWRMSQKK